MLWRTCYSRDSKINLIILFIFPQKSIKAVIRFAEEITKFISAGKTKTITKFRFRWNSSIWYKFLCVLIKMKFDLAQALSTLFCWLEKGFKTYTRKVHLKVCKLQVVASGFSESHFV